MFAGGLSLLPEWLQVSSCLQDSSQYSCRSQQCCSGGGFNAPIDFPFLQILFHVPGNHPDYYSFFLLLVSFSHQRYLIAFHWSLSDSKSPQVSRTLFSILADLINVVVKWVSTLPVISKSSSPCTNLFMILPSMPIIVSMSVIFMFCSLFFFSSQTRS